MPHRHRTPSQRSPSRRSSCFWSWRGRSLPASPVSRRHRHPPAHQTDLLAPAGAPGTRAPARLVLPNSHRPPQIHPGLKRAPLGLPWPLPPALPWSLQDLCWGVPTPHTHGLLAARGLCGCAPSRPHSALAEPVRKAWAQQGLFPPSPSPPLNGAEKPISFINHYRGGLGAPRRHGQGCLCFPLTSASGTASGHHDTHNPLPDSLGIPIAPYTPPCLVNSPKPPSTREPCRLTQDPQISLCSPRIPLNPRVPPSSPPSPQAPSQIAPAPTTSWATLTPGVSCLHFGYQHPAPLTEAMLRGTGGCRDLADGETEAEKGV